MTEQHEDTARLKFLAEAINDACVHIVTKPEKRIVQMYTRPSDWITMPLGERIDLDDLRMLIDEAMETEV